MHVHDVLPLGALVLAASVCASAAWCQGTAPVAPASHDFEDGVNDGNWDAYTIAAAPVIELDGGNPGGYLHVPSAVSKGPYLQCNELGGDWRAAHVERMSFDVRFEALDFHPTAPYYGVAIVLIDLEDYSYAWRVLGDIPQVGAGWTTFDFDIPSQDTAQHPVGWTCGHHDDYFWPAADWNEIITSIDRVEIYWMSLEYQEEIWSLPAHTWSFGLDNVRLFADGLVAVRNGSGVNPLGYASSTTPDLGSTWTATVDLATPGHVLSAIAISAGGPTAGLFPGGPVAGELLALPPYGVDVGTGAHAFAIPATLSLLGQTVTTQAATVAADGTVHLNNALDLVLGG